MRNPYSRTAWLILASALTWSSAQAQVYNVKGKRYVPDSSPVLVIDQATLIDTLVAYDQKFFTSPVTTCTDSFMFSTRPTYLAEFEPNSGTDPMYIPTIVGGYGNHSFYMRLQGSIHSNPNSQSNPNNYIFGVNGSTVEYDWDWNVRVDGHYIGIATLVESSTWDISGSGFDNGFNQLLKITFSTEFKTVPELTLFQLQPRIKLDPYGSSGRTAPVSFSFDAAVLGEWYDNVGELVTPKVPSWVLRDPPGDASQSTWASGTTQCVGESISASTDNSASGFVKVKIGVEGEIGFIVTTSYEIFAEFGVNFSGGRTDTENSTYQTCLTSSTSLSTPAGGTPDDIFFGSSVRYYYGLARIVQRQSCAAPTDTAQLKIIPKEVEGSFQYTESYIRNTLIPDLQADIAQLVPGTETWNVLTRDLDVWTQVLAVNDSIKAEADYAETKEFNSGTVGDFSLETTTEETRSIQYNVFLEEGLTAEFGAYIGGTGVGSGAAITFRQEWGSEQNASNTSTNSVGYHLEDAGSDDNFVVKIKHDKIYGTPVFELDSAVSATSCPYEGGYQIDQPQLWVGSIGSSQMVLNEVPVGSGAAFPLYVCNNSDRDATYYLKFRTNSNTEGGVLNAFGNQMNSNDNGLELDIPAGECLGVTNLVLTQPGTPIGPDYNIEIYLYSLCESSISSSVLIEAHYGAGNIAGYCEPSSASGTSGGDWIDGVQVGAISNTGTGGVSGPTYTDYTGQYSTPLSRNATAMLTVTSGAWAVDRYTAWIDYDHDAAFEATENLGEFTTNQAYQSQNIVFVVPNTAVLGTTVMRVRGSDPNFMTPIFDPCAPYVYGETEDYAVVINANTPQDCAGVNNGTALPGTTCSDGNAGTGNDTWNANCACIGVVIDCAGVPGGSSVAGIACDDGNANTVSDVYGADCICAGQLLDCAGVAGGTGLPGSACDDENADTGGDVWGNDCVCAGQLLDCLGVPGGSVLVGVACDDGNPVSTSDTYDENCTCVGVLSNDCLGVLGGTAQPGTFCDDGDFNTGADLYNANCICVGSPLDCYGTPGGSALPGEPCNDWNPQTANDVIDADCQCFGTLIISDCLGIEGGTAQPGSACDDGDANTVDDVWSSFCACAGVLLDCTGTPGGSALPGLTCDDGFTSTGNDVWDANCICAGLTLDCANEPGGTALPGTACDDGSASTSNDIYNLDCICAGTLANDCEGVAGGTAQPGTPCDDGNADTGEDVYDAGCTCAGQPLDCAGVLNGVDLPGGICNDNQDCTVGDIWSTDCVCSGTAVTIGNVSGSTLVIGLTSNAYFVTPVAGATSYEWTLPNGWTTADNSAFVIVAEANNTPGDVELCVTATVGACEVTSCITVTVDFNTGITTPVAASSDWFILQPNPNNGMFQLMPSGSDKSPIRVTVNDGIGRQVLAPITIAGQRSIAMDLGSVAPGAYYLFATRNGEQQAVKVMVTH